MNVEMIFLGPSKNKHIGDINGLIYLLMSNSTISLIEQSERYIKINFNSKEIDIYIQKSMNKLNETFYHVKLNGEFQSLAAFRAVILGIVNDYFVRKYIIFDEVSMELCKSVYPKINEIENLLRKYIMNFMLLKVGSEWWDLNVTDSTKKKAKERDIKSSYSNFVNQEIFHIDFKDLGEFIINNFSAFKSKNDILRKLNECTTLNDFQELKKQISSNWEKYFKDTFTKKFLENFNELAELRNKIAHNKLIEQKDINKINNLYDELKLSIENALSEINNFDFSAQELDVIRTRIKEQHNTVLESAIESLPEGEGTISKIMEIIRNFKDAGKDQFTTIEIVRMINDGNYTTGNPLNKSIGVVLSCYKDLLEIEATTRIADYDDNSSPTTTLLWKFIKK